MVLGYGVWGLRLNKKGGIRYSMVLMEREILVECLGAVNIALGPMGKRG